MLPMYLTSMWAHPRVVIGIGILCAVDLGCAGSGAGDAGLSDAARADGSVDGSADSGGATTPCGDRECRAEEFCHVLPTGACTPSDGGGCMAPTFEPCVRQGVSGCSARRDRACEAIPATCAARVGCACLINANLCPATVNADCRRIEGQGFTVECPFP